MADASQTPVVELTGATKHYEGVPAIERVDFTLFPGEVHALLGENGAGKSTLCKVICGTVGLTSGTMAVHGQPVDFRSPSDALNQGIAMVYQETSLVPTMTVAQNIHLGREPFFSVFRNLNIRAQLLLQSMNFHVDPTALASTLGTAKRQMIEIARAVYFNAKVIIFDEPTASLTPEETQHLFTLIQDLRSQGVAIIYISHALEEALSISDRVTVLRDGKLVSTQSTSGLSRDTLVRMMVGRQLGPQQRDQAARAPKPRGEKILSVENVVSGTMVKNMSFSVYAGEVTTIAGLVGSGRTEIAKVISGAMKRRRLQGGTITFNGRDVRYRVPAQGVNDGIAYVTEDRKENGLFETMSIDENIYVGYIAKAKRRLLTSKKERKALAEKWISTLQVAAIHRRAKVVELSGGNQQKVVIAKSLVQNPQLVIFDEPTRGVDVGTIEQIHALIRELAATGIAVVVISSYLPEVLAVSDRILVARQGRIVEQIPADGATEERIMWAAIH
ncbi:sugar ABC transporter ATP-binding protein [Metarhizobium album]|uniref:Sugar ABC transporter ATP-binding protein n=1 Tax=Metarhizobium album TaxID=2182425 RepID=A0A2U2DUI6_9HYPH|nr:sugar ABC transporter ATP-binding protein [Rhizobium album]PWE56962.1 sugar ABC transporter ATP-binding protein [Rhizobium album]